MIDIGIEKLSLEQFVKKLLYEEITPEQNSLFNIRRKNNKSGFVDNYVSKKGFDIFLDEELKRLKQ